MPKIEVTLLLVTLGLLPSLCLGANNTWQYTIGRMVEKQQVTVCQSQAIVETIADTFQSQGPRAGYALISQAPECHIEVLSFTPNRIAEKFSVKTESSAYTIHFIEITTADDTTHFLFTTRNVKVR